MMVILVIMTNGVIVFELIKDLHDNDKDYFQVMEYL